MLTSLPPSYKMTHNQIRSINSETVSQLRNTGGLQSAILKTLCTHAFCKWPEFYVCSVRSSVRYECGLNRTDFVGSTKPHTYTLVNFTGETKTVLIVCFLLYSCEIQTESMF